MRKLRKMRQCAASLPDGRKKMSCNTLQFCNDSCASRLKSRGSFRGLVKWRCRSPCGAGCGYTFARCAEALHWSKILRTALPFKTPLTDRRSPSAAVRIRFGRMPPFHGRTPIQIVTALLANQAYLVVPPPQLFSPEGQGPQRMQIAQWFLLAITR